MKYLGSLNGLVVSSRLLLLGSKLIMCLLFVDMYMYIGSVLIYLFEVVKKCEIVITYLTMFVILFIHVYEKGNTIVV